MACPEETHMGWPTIYTKDNATDSWMNKLDLDKAAVVIMNGGVWYNWLHGYGKFPEKSFDSSTMYIKMLEHITPGRLMLSSCDSKFPSIHQYSFKQTIMLQL